MWTTLMTLWLALSGPARTRTAQRRPAFRRPAGRPRVEGLEERTVPTAFSGFAAIGDSYTVPRGGNNWTEQLAIDRGLNFGPSYAYVQTGYPRQMAGGAVSPAVAAVVSQVAAGNVSLVYVDGVANDFAVNFQAIYQGTLAGTDLSNFIGAEVADVRAELDDLSAAGPVKFVMENVGDVGDLPNFSQNYTDPVGRQRMTDAAQAANTAIYALADARHIPVVDQFAWAKRLFSATNPPVVGGLQLNVSPTSLPYNTVVVTDPLRLFVDSSHVGPVAQGLKANVVLGAIRRAYGLNVAPFTDQEILDYAYRQAGQTPPALTGTSYYDVSGLVHYAAPSAGALDPNFRNGGIVTTEFNSSAPAAAGDETGAWDMAVQPNDGKIILVGDVGSATTGYEMAVARYNANGVLDTAFGQNGRVTLSFGSSEAHGYGVTVQPDGKIVVVGPTYNSATGLHEFAVARLLPNGALDPNFFSADDNLGPGMVTVGFDGVDVSPTRLPLRAQLQGNKIVLCAMSNNYVFAPARLNSDGSVDNSFGTAGNGRVVIPVGGIYGAADAVIEPSGKIVIADETGRVFRLNNDGSPDNTFTNQSLDFSAYWVSLDAQGNILISGRNDEETFSHQDWVVARLGADGNLDTTFGTGGEAQISIDSTHETATSLAVQANGKIVVIGPVWTNPDGFLHEAAARLTADGQLDTSFGSQGSVFLPLDDMGNVTVDPAGGILIPGTIYQPSTIYDIAFLRLLGDPVANADAYTANQDSALAVPAAAGVLANDTDSIQAPLTASLVGGPAHAASFALNADGSFTYTPAAGYVGPDSFTYDASDGSDSSNVATVSLTVQPLQAALSGLATGGTLTVQTTAPDQTHDLIAAANGLDPATTPACTLVVDLGGQTIQDTTINVPPQVTVQFTNGTFIGGSPALLVSSGDVVVRNSLFLNATPAPTILVTGGSLTLRNDIIQESTSYTEPAISVTGGTVDLGTTATDPGGNTINVNGTGTFLRNTTGYPISAVNDTFEVGGQATAWPIALTVNTTSSLMLVGKSPPPLTGSVNGIPFTGSTTYTTAFGDAVTVTLGTTATAASQVGQCAITAHLSGPGADNYAIAPASTAGTMYVVSVGADPSSTTGAQAVTFWDNKGNAKLITAADLSSLDALNLVTQGGSAFDPHSVAQLEAWLSVSPNATPAYQLAVQLAALDLNVLAGYVKGTDLVYAGGLLPYATADSIAGLTSGGFIDVADLMAAANAALAQVSPGAPANDPNQAYELALAKVLQAANGNTDFVSQEASWNLLGLYLSLI
jgi:uncharacterized delta-60 repeat protein